MNTFLLIFSLFIFYATVVTNEAASNENPFVIDIPDRCELPRNPGVGDLFRIYFYYDKRVNTCVEFVYKGQGGKGNRFLERDECRKACVKPPTTTTTSSKTSTSSSPPTSPKPTIPTTIKINAPPTTAEEATPSSKPHVFGPSVPLPLSKDEICNLLGPPTREWPTDSPTAFYYDAEANECYFVYFDEESKNANNFQTYEECENLCVDNSTTNETPLQNICSLPPPPTKDWTSDSLIGFWYDEKLGECEPVYYDEESKNANNFPTENECLEACKPHDVTVPLPHTEATTMKSISTTPTNVPTTPTTTTTVTPQSTVVVDICSLPIPPRRPWPPNSLTGYSYDVTVGTCIFVYYDPPTKNANNFPTMDGCLAKCKPTPPPTTLIPTTQTTSLPTTTTTATSITTAANHFIPAPECYLSAPSPGLPFPGYLMSYTYTSVLDRCWGFYYSVPEKNKYVNYFKTFDECLTKCKPTPPPTTTTTPISTTTTQTTTNPTTPTTTITPKTTTHEVATTTPTKKLEPKHISYFDIVRRPECSLQYHTGHCFGFMFFVVPKTFHTRYYFNINKMKCEEFYFSGCQPNANNYANKSICEENCLYPKKTTLPHPTIPIPKVSTHEPTTTTTTTAKTTTTTTKKPKPSCRFPNVTIICHDNSTHFYYDQTAEECVELNGGKCDKSALSFPSDRACLKKCNPHELHQRDLDDVKTFIDKCKPPIKVGPCKAKKLRFYHDIQDGKCKSFTYGGCKANQNNYKTLEECNATCAIVPPALIATHKKKCNLPKLQNPPCNSFFDGFLYDHETNKCKHTRVENYCPRPKSLYEKEEDCLKTCELTPYLLKHE